MNYTCSVIVRNSCVSDEYIQFDGNIPSHQNRPFYIESHPPTINTDACKASLFAFVYHMTGAFSQDIKDEVVDNYLLAIIVTEPAQQRFLDISLNTTYDYRSAQLRRINYKIRVQKYEVNINLMNHEVQPFTISLMRPYDPVQRPPENMICDTCLECKVDCTVMPCRHFSCAFCIHRKMGWRGDHIDDLRLTRKAWASATDTPYKRHNHHQH